MASRRRSDGDLILGLGKLGLSPQEAKIYLALLERGRLAAPAIVEITGIPRGSIYPVLTSLTDRGIVQAGAGWGGRYQPVPPEQAIAALLRWEREALAERERLGETLTSELKQLAARGADNLTPEPLEVIRDRRALADRFETLASEAQKEYAALVKAPILQPGGGESVLLKALSRGVRVRCIYEVAVLSDDQVAPGLAEDVKRGEQARVFDGVLPHKLAVFDGIAAILPMTGSMSEVGTTSLVIRDPMVATGLLALFESFWERSRPLQLAPAEVPTKQAKPLRVPDGGRKPSGKPAQLNK